MKVHYILDFEHSILLVLSKIKSSLKKAKERWDKDPDDLILKALEAGFLDEYEDALEILDEGIYLFTTKLDDHDTKSNLFYYKAMALQNLDRFPEALEAINKAIEFDKKDPAVWEGKTHILHDLEKYEEALISINKASKFVTKKELPDILYNKADILSHLKQNKEALELYNKILKTDSKDAASLWGKSDELLELGKVKESLKSCEEGLKLQPDSVDLIIQKGVILMELRNYKEALSLFEDAIRYDPTEELAWYNKACALSRLNKPDEALDALTVATSIEPDNIEKIKEEKDFDNLRKTEKFNHMLNQAL